MFQRLRRLLFSLIAVLLAYGVYRLVAVPFIEPSAAARQVLVLTPGTLSNAAQKLRWANLETLFPADAWEMQTPKVLETAQGMLLLNEYHPRADGRLEIKPCTLILYKASDKPDDDSHNARPIVMQAPEGAVLLFDQALDFARGRIGELRGGMLEGPVTIRGPESKPGAGDDLWIRTHDVSMSRKRIVAPHEIEFRYGSSSGNGRQLIVDLAEPDSGDEKTKLGVKSLKLVHVHKIRIQIDDTSKLTGDKPKETPTQPIVAEIKCNGPFRFNFDERVATFEDQVRIIRMNQSGPRDQLTCELLSMFFSEKQAAESVKKDDKASKKVVMPSMDIERIRATGSPAVLRAPSYSASARGEILEYNLKTNEVRVDDSRKVLLKYQNNSVEARHLQYAFGENGKLGELRSSGPGVIRASLPDDPKKTFDVTWQDRAVIQHHEGSPVISLISKARVAYHGMGEFSADKLHVWLKEVVKPGREGEKPKTSYLPDRMLAEGNVNLDSWQVSGRMGRAEIWVRDSPTRRLGPATLAESQRQEQSTSPLADNEAAKSGAKYDIRGKHVQLQLLRIGKRTLLQDAILNGDVRLREIRTAKPGEVPIDIAAEIVQIYDAQMPNARIRVEGQPAVMAARGASLTGSNLHVSRAENRMWIAGPGEMSMPAQLASKDQSVPPRAAAPNEPINVSWKGGMEFDGLTAQFDRDVEVTTVQNTDKGEQLNVLVMGHHLDVKLNQPIDFTKTKAPPDTNVHLLTFPGGVFMQNSGTTRGAPSSYDQLQIRDLTINYLTGELHANGRGWGSSVRPGDQITRGGADRADPRTTAAVPVGNGLSFVRIEYDDEIVGNIKQRVMEFRGRVRTVYGPVANWNQTLAIDPLDGFQKNQFLMTSDRLAIAQIGTSPQPDSAQIELAALGNATIEGKSFTARGARISYARAKNMLVLEGDGRSDAELWLNSSVNPDAAAQQIRFWTDSYRFSVDRGKYLNLSQMGLGGL